MIKSYEKNMVKRSEEISKCCFSLVKWLIANKFNYPEISRKNYERTKIVT